MARSNIAVTRVKPEVSELLQLEVLRTERLSPHFMRVTLGRGDLERFGYLGFDQWFRLFIPVSEDSLSRAPQKLTTMSYVKYLTVSKSTRPLLRNYTVRGYRPDGPELDLDIVLHETTDATAGPAMTWARSCRAGDKVAIIDEGIGFTPPAGLDRFVLVADESGLPAVAGILGSLPSDAVGQVILEIPSDADRQALECPAGVELTWVVRDDAAAIPGRRALAVATALPAPTEPFYGWAVGESALPVAMRRHWVAAGVPKEHIMFCGYWKSSQKS